MAESARERRLRKVELFGRHCAEKGFDAVGANFDVVVEKQDRLVAQEQIRPKLHEASNGGCFGSRLNNCNVGLRMDVALMVVVEENVMSTRLFKVGCVKPFSALDEDKNVALGMSRFTFDAQLASGIEAILARPQFLAIERRPHLALAERAVEHSEGCFFKRSRFHAACDVADEFNIDIRPRTPAGAQSVLEKVQERMGMALGPIRILRHVPGVVEFGGRGGPGSGWASMPEQPSARVRDVRVGAEPARIEEGVRAVAAALADQRVMQRRERRRDMAEQAPPRVEARPQRSPASLRKPRWKTHVRPIVSAGRSGNRTAAPRRHVRGLSRWPALSCS